jgi:hypothetical protein
MSQNTKTMLDETMVFIYGNTKESAWLHLRVYDALDYTRNTKHCARWNRSCSWWNESCDCML